MRSSVSNFYGFAEIEDCLQGRQCKIIFGVRKKCAPLRTLLLYSAVLEGIPAFARPLLFLRDAPGRARPLLFLRDAQNLHTL